MKLWNNECAQIGRKERTFWREEVHCASGCCMVNSTSAWATCSIYSDTASAEFRGIFTLLALRRATQSCCEEILGSEFVFIHPRLPSTVLVSAELYRAHRIVTPFRGHMAHSSIWPPPDSGSSAIVSYPSYGASDHILESSVNLVLV